MTQFLSEAFKALSTAISRKDALETRIRLIDKGVTRIAWDKSLFEGNVVLITGAGSGKCIEYFKDVRSSLNSNHGQVSGGHVLSNLPCMVARNSSW
jgi:hypothetical protein